MVDKLLNLDRSNSLRSFLIGLPRSAKRAIALSADFVGFIICACTAEWLLFETNLLAYPQILWACLVVALVAVALAWFHGLYRSIVRFAGADVFVAGAKTAVGSAIFGAVLMYAAQIGASPIKWAVAYAGAAFIFVSASRYIARQFLVKRKAKLKRDRVVIYGAGSAGSQLAVGLLGGDQYLPVAIVDDDLTLRGATVKGLNVHSPDDLDVLIENTGATRVLLAMPGASRRQRRVVLERLSSYPVHVQTMPGLLDLVSGQAKVDDISDVEVRDLLGRDPVPPNQELLGVSITGKNVIVTGAGGSIGSELCRHIIRLNPKRLVLFELSEIALYDIEKELTATAAETDAICEIVALLGSVHHKERIQEVLETFDIDTVYHAAAYKHVPVVEHNILEGVHNNVFGTYYLAKAAIAAGVGTFVLISTDKAVSPTNVMGATKRFAELVLQALQDNQPDVRFCMVRFGNVLESSGSVVPLFRKQIRAGGPVTVTHREIIRYFMTIPEAAELVIQAAAMAEGGDVFVLDMGEPVRILDLAMRMIRLMGLTICDEDNPDGDIKIVFTGLRPAEKLYEELLIGSDVSGTEHPRILRANEERIPADVLLDLIDDLQDATTTLDRERTREILLRTIRGYGPTNGIEDLVWVNQRKRADADHTLTVVEFPS